MAALNGLYQRYRFQVLVGYGSVMSISAYFGDVPRIARIATRCFTRLRNLPGDQTVAHTDSVYQGQALVLSGSGLLQ